MNEGTLKALGSASRGWIREARGLVRALPGIERYNDSATYAALRGGKRGFTERSVQLKGYATELLAYQFELPPE